MSISSIRNDSVKAFAEACYDMNSEEELRDALEGDADDTDMNVWGIDAAGWKEAISAALAEKLEDNA